MKLKPLGDRVVLQKKPVEEKNAFGIILPDNAKEKSQEAIVVAVGPGKYIDGKLSEMQVKEGDTVVYSKYSGTEVEVDNDDYIVVSQSDIIAIIE